MHNIMVVVTGEVTAGDIVVATWEAATLAAERFIIPAGMGAAAVTISVVGPSTILEAMAVEPFITGVPEPFITPADMGAASFIMAERARSIIPAVTVAESCISIIPASIWVTGT